MFLCRMFGIFTEEQKPFFNKTKIVIVIIDCTDDNFFYIFLNFHGINKAWNYVLHFGILHDKILKFAVSLWLHFLCGLMVFTVHVHSLSWV